MKAIGRTWDCTLSVLEKTRVRVAIACWSSMVVGRSMRRLLKESWLFLFWHFEFFQKFLQPSNFNLIISRGWRTFFHIFRNDLWYSWIIVRGISHQLLLNEGSMMEEDDRISKKRCVNLSLGIVESKNKKKTKRKFSFRFDCHRSTVIHCDCYFHSNDKPCWA